MKILIVEPNSSGHHMAMHLRTIILKLQKTNHELSLLTTKAAKNSSIYKILKKEMTKHINEYFIDEIEKNNSSVFQNIIWQFKFWIKLKQKFSQISKINKPDIVLIPTLDWIVKAIEILGSPFGKTNFTGVYISPKHHRKKANLGAASRQDWIYNFLFKKLLKIKTIKKLLIFEEDFIKYASENYKELSHKIRFIPDFALIKKKSSKKDARINLGIDQRSKVILVYGSLSLRKGIKELLMAMTHPNIPKDIVVLLAGKPDSDIKNIISKIEIKNLINKKKLFTCFKFHNSFEEQQAFAATDLVWLGYMHGFGHTSGILYQAIKCNLLVIGQDSGVVGKYIKNYKLGKTVFPDKTDQVIKKISDLLNQKKLYLKQGKIYRKNLKKIHSPEKFGQILLKTLQESLS